MNNNKISQSPVFVFGAFRSGTTAFCHFLQEATNATVYIEQTPKLCIEARRLYEGNLSNPGNVVHSAKVDSISKAQTAGLVYVDKNPNYMIFAQWLIERFECKLVFLHRDGRDVVRSMIDWHAVQNKDIFTLAEDEKISKRAVGSSFPWDYSLFRPLKGDNLHDKWPDLSRFQKCAWYWAKYNEIALDMTAHQKFKDRVLTINMTGAGPEEVKKAYEFIGLNGFNYEKIKSILQSRINSIKWRSGQGDKFPSWKQWSAEQTAQFNEFAQSMMERLGYY